MEGRFLSVYSKKIGVFILIMVKLLMSVVITCFPKVMKVCYPFALFTPIFLSAIAYIGVPKWIALIMLVVIFSMELVLLVLPILLLVKKRDNKWITIVLQVFFIVEAVCLGVSFFMGGFFRKLLGVILNIIIAALLSEIRQVQEYGEEE